MSSELKRFLKYVDEVLEKAKAIYDLGANCQVYFNNIGENYEILESEKEIVEKEINKRDVGQSRITWWEGCLSTVTVRNPWG